jgi:hypothetical protein
MTEKPTRYAGPDLESSAGRLEQGVAAPAMSGTSARAAVAVTDKDRGALGRAGTPHRGAHPWQREGLYEPDGDALVSPEACGQGFAEQVEAFLAAATLGLGRGPGRETQPRGNKAAAPVASR